jgi:hypothetical protein
MEKSTNDMSSVSVELTIVFIRQSRIFAQSS